MHIGRESENYPFLLREIGSAPKQLYVRGNHQLLSASLLIAVVGTRKISDYGRQVIQSIIPPLVRSGAVIVSGLAFGVDSVAHEIALEHGGKCIAVLAGGVDTIYPREHHGLAKKILSSGGTIISEHEPGTQSLKQYFPARNRIISGLSRATIIIEAQEESGSLITAKFALEQNREVYAVPGSIFEENQRGTNTLIAEGAYPLLSAEALMSQLNLTLTPEQQIIPLLNFDSEEEKTLYEFLREPQSLDELHQKSDIPTTALNQLISLMELKGMVMNVSGSKYSRK